MRFHFDLWRPQLYSFFCFTSPEVAAEQPQLLSDSQSLTHLSGSVEEAAGRGLKERDWMNHLEGESCRENRRFILKELSQQSLFL